MYESNEPIIQEPGLYVAAFFHEDTNNAITKYLKDNNIPNPIPSPGFHTTIVHSKVPVNFEPNHSVDVTVDLYSASLECWDLRDGKRALVLHYFTPYLQLRFDQAMEAGATYDFDEYKQHVTLSYDVGQDFDHTSLPHPTFELSIVGEYGEDIELTY